MPIYNADGTVKELKFQGEEYQKPGYRPPVRTQAAPPASRMGNRLTQERAENSSLSSAITRQRANLKKLHSDIAGMQTTKEALAKEVADLRELREEALTMEHRINRLREVEASLGGEVKTTLAKLEAIPALLTGLNQAMHIVLALSFRGTRPQHRVPEGWKPAKAELRRSPASRKEQELARKLAPPD